MASVDQGQHVFQSSHMEANEAIQPVDVLETVLHEPCISTFCLMELLQRWSGCSAQKGAFRGAAERELQV